MQAKKKRVTKKLSATKEVKVNEAEISGNHNNDSKQSDEEIANLRRTLHSSSIENAFSQIHHPSALDYIVNPGEIIRGMLMRGDISSKPSEGVRKAVAIAHHLAKAREFNDEGAIQEALDMLAITTSIDGKRIDLLVKAIIGEYQSAKEQKGVGNWIKKMAFGNEQNKDSVGGV